MSPKVADPQLDRGDQQGHGSAGLAEVRRTRSGRLLRRLCLVVVVCVAVAGVVALSTRTRSGSSEEPSAASSASSHVRSTTTTQATTTTAAPPVSVPAITVGALVGGPGPIPVIRRVPTFDPVVFITIDDGVHPEEDALTVIRDEKLPVTLFLNQTYLKANGDYFRRLQDAGAVIGTHTMSHADLKGTDPGLQHSQICDLVGEFRDRFGQVPTLFRPPYGSYDRVTLEQAASCGITTAVHWSAVADSGTIVTADGPLRPGDIILLHFKPGLGLKLRAVVAQASAAGLRPASLADYIASAPRPTAPPPPPLPPTPPAG